MLVMILNRMVSEVQLIVSGEDCEGAIPWCKHRRLAEILRLKCGNYLTKSRWQKEHINNYCEES